MTVPNAEVETQLQEGVLFGGKAIQREIGLT